MRLIIAAVAGTTFLALVIVLGIAQAETPTPSPSSSPPPFPFLTPTPFPSQSSTITMRWTRGGQPFPVRLGSAETGIQVDKVSCKVLAPGVEIITTDFRITWPLVAAEDQPPECSGGPPKTIEFTFTSDAFEQWIASVDWTGADVTLNFVVPMGDEASPTASVPALPPTGGRVDSGPSMVDDWLAVLGVLALFGSILALRFKLKLRRQE